MIRKAVLAALAGLIVTSCASAAAPPTTTVVVTPTAAVPINDGVAGSDRASLGQSVLVRGGTLVAGRGRGFNRVQQP